MKPDHLHGFWEMPSPSFPDALDYMHVLPDGKMLSLGPTPVPKNSWFKLWYRYRLTEGGEFVIRPCKGSGVEQVMTVQWEGTETLILQRTTQSPHEWRFTRVPWAHPPAFLEKRLQEAHRELAEWENQQGGVTPP